VDVHYHFVQEFVVDGYIKIIFVKTDKNKADGFTKNVKSEVFEKHSKDFVWDKEECGNTALAYQIMEDEQETVLKEKHWTSVGRVLEVSLDSSIDAHAFTSTDVNTQINRVIYPKFKDEQIFPWILGSTASAMRSRTHVKRLDINLDMDSNRCFEDTELR